MKDDLISRKPLVDMLQGVEDNIFAEAMREVNPNKAFVAGVVQEVKNQVLALPAVDVVPVVRCRECQYCSTFRMNGIDYPLCMIADKLKTPDGFCDEGVKRDLEEEDDG